MLVLKIVQANAVYDPATRDANALLDKYHTLTEWSSAMASAGAQVLVVQRFHTASRLERDGVTYEFVKDSQVPWLSTTAAPAEFVDAIARHTADVIHVNGLIFPQLVARIRKAVGPRALIVVQHHGGEFPIRADGLLGMWRRRRWRDGLSGADAASFTAREQAEPWRAAGVLANQRIVEVVESGTTLRHVERSRARTAIGIGGDPLVLWVGRLTTNKDPLTVLDALEHALAELPNARVAMLFGDDTLIEAVDDRVRSSPTLSEHVTLVGRSSRDEIPNYYGAADIFISGSHSEGSGYALVESMAAGVIPVVTDIPSHRAIAGDAGALWPAGAAAACARALLQVCATNLTEQKKRVLERYQAVLRWDAIATKTIREYQSLVEAKRAATS